MPERGWLDARVARFETAYWVGESVVPREQKSSVRPCPFAGLLVAPPNVT
jgi:hypothetical protein